MKRGPIPSTTRETRDDESAPLHSPKLTQRRAHPAVVYSTPAGERQRPRVRRGHEQKSRGGVRSVPTLCFISRDGVPDNGRLSATCERRENLNSYGRGECALEICLVSRKSIDQNRTCFDHLVETRI